MANKPKISPPFIIVGAIAVVILLVLFFEFLQHHPVFAWIFLSVSLIVIVMIAVILVYWLIQRNST